MSDENGVIHVINIDCAFDVTNSSSSTKSATIANTPIAKGKN